MFIPHFSFIDPSLGEQFQKVRVSIVGVPADMANMLKSTRGSDVCFGKFGFLFLVLVLILFAFTGQR